MVKRTQRSGTPRPPRKTEPKPINAVHDPLPAVLLPRFLDNAFDWFSTEGFAEMHAVEQAAVVFLRVLDLHPFTTLNETMALLAASFYVERAGFLIKKRYFPAFKALR